MINFSYYIKQFWKALPLLLLVSFFAGFIAYVVSSRIETTYEAHFSYLVALSAREEVEEYRFDGYYALQATDLFSRTLAQWLVAPETIARAFNDAGLELPNGGAGALARFVRADQTSPQLVQVTARGKSRLDAEILAEGVRVVIQRNIEEYHDVGIPAVSFRVVATDEWVGMKRVSVSVITISVFVFTFFFSLNVFLLVLSFKRSNL